MSDAKPKFFTSPEDDGFNLYRQAPIPGTEDAQNPAGAMVRGIISDLAANNNGITECLKCALELDPESYAYYITGTSVNITRLDGEHLGYSIHISIYPSLNEAKPRSPKRVAKLPRSKY